MSSVQLPFDEDPERHHAPPTTSDVRPSQLAAWHGFNWTGTGDSGGFGEWLRCLKSTREFQRQYVWSEGAIRGVVAFAGWVRDCGGFYEGWSSLTRLPRPVLHEQLLRNPVTRPRFDRNGICALQGLPIRLEPEVAAAVNEMAGNPGPTEMPIDEPDYSEEPILWAGPHGLAPESYVEAAVAASRSLSRRLGFTSAPDRQVTLGTAGRCDLLAGGVVGEAKRVVTVTNGPDQIERYLGYLHFQQRMPRRQLKGVLIQCADATSQAVVERLQNSDYHAELWSLVDTGARWRLRRLA